MNMMIIILKNHDEDAQSANCKSFVKHVPSKLVKKVTD